MSKLFYYLICLILFSVTTLHAAESADVYFNAGTKALNKGDYEAAKDLFERATKQGLNRAELHFNLAISYYRLGQFKKAQNAFYKTLQDKKTMPLAHYNLGLVAKQLNDKTKAKQWFQRAYNNNNNKKIRALADKQLKILGQAELHFKLGVSYYKLGQYEKSQDAFNKALQDEKTMPLAHYNLGLVAKQLSDETKAEQWFQRAYDDNNEKTRTLADKQLKILEDKTTDSRWLSVSLSARYDDSLVDPVLDTGNGQGEFFSELLVSSGGPIFSETDNALQFDITLYLNRHQKLDFYDFDLFIAGLSQPFNTGNWTNKIGVQLEYSTFADLPYQRARVFNLTTQYKPRKMTQYGLRYIFREIESLDTIYDYLQGEQHQLTMQVKWSNISTTSLLYTFEINKFDDLTDGTTFSSYSPKKHTLNLAHEQPIVKTLTLQTKLAYQVSRYPDANILISGDRIFRRDTRALFSLSLIKQLNTTWDINLEYQYSENESNISGLSYASNLYSVGVQASF